MWTIMDLIRNFFTHKDFLPGADRMPGTLFTPLHFMVAAFWAALIVLLCLFLRKKEERTLRRVFAGAIPEVSQEPYALPQNLKDFYRGKMTRNVKCCCGGSPDCC